MFSYPRGYLAQPSDSRGPSWQTHRPQSSGQSQLPSLHYVQRLEQDLEAARNKIQECEATIVHQAHIIRQSSHLKAQHAIICPNCNQEVPHACASPFDVSVTAPEAQALSTSDIPGSNALPPAQAASIDPPPPQRSILQHLWASTGPLFRLQVSNNIPTPLTTSRSSTPASSFSQAISTAVDNNVPNRSNWSVEFNPNTNGALKMDLMRTIADKRGAYRIKFSPDGQLLAVVARISQVVTIYNTASGMKICVLEDLYERKRNPSTQDLCFSPNGKFLVTCTENIIRIWEIGKKHVRSALKGHLESIFSLDFSPNGRLVASGSHDRTIRIWNMRDGSSRILDDSHSMFWCVRFSPDGRHIAAGNDRGQLSLWELGTGNLVVLLKAHSHLMDLMAFMPSGEGLISGSWDNTLKHWDITLARISDKNRHGASGDSTRLEMLRSFLDASVKQKLAFVGHDDIIRSISISPDGQWLASSSKDGSVRIWNTGTGTRECIVHGHNVNVFSVDFSRVGDYLASASEDGQVRIWSYT